jgi:hypothetical protein
MHQVVNGVTYEVRQLTTAVGEHAVKAAINRGLISRDAPPWQIVGALYAARFDPDTVSWLHTHGWKVDPSSVEALIQACNELIRQLPR